MKALILAAGRGKRLKKKTGNQNKCMLEIKGKPLIECNLDNAVNTDVDDIIIVVGYRAEDIINKYGNRYRSKRIKYVIQHEQRGLVDAIECSRRMMDGSDFMLMLGDELMVNPRHKAFVEKYNEGKLFGLCGVVMVQDKDLIKKTYALIQDKDDVIYRLIEKPANPINNIMGTGNCIFRNDIFDYIERSPINQVRGEKELPDLIQCAIDDGHTIKYFIICDRYINVNFPEEIDKASSYFKHF